MTRVFCPNCDNSFAVTDGVTDYDWESGVYDGGVKELVCPYCRSGLTVYAQATVDIAEVVLDD